MKLIEHTPATKTTPEIFLIANEMGTQYRVSAPFEIPNLFKHDWSAYINGKGARYVTNTKPGQAVIEFAKTLKQ